MCESYLASSCCDDAQAAAHLVRFQVILIRAAPGKIQYLFDHSHPS